MSKSRFTWRLAAAVGAGLAAGAAMFRCLRRRPDPDDAERRRRSHVSQVGRIVDGQIVDIIEVAPQSQESSASTQSRRARAADSPAVNGGHRHLVEYSYSISGVSYETAQDVTGLEELAAIHRLAAGQPASVKYDPANPGNSILISDDWSGLR